MLEKSLHLFTGFEWNSSLFEPRQELFPKGLPKGNSLCEGRIKELKTRE